MRLSLLSDRASWMKSISDNQSLAHMSIPGTHNSCARKGSTGQISLIERYVITQRAEATLPQQLEDGIRYLDIRCCAIDGVFTIHHGSFYLNMNFGQVLNYCLDFLYQHPSETILMRIKQENSSVSDYDFIRIFEQKYQSYLEKMYRRSTIPTLGEVRGKIVIISNVAGLPGIQWYDLGLQDDYNASTSNKVTLVKRYVEECVTTNTINDRKKLYLNHTSIAGSLSTPESYAGTVIPNITKAFQEGLGLNTGGERQNKTGYIGIIAMDYYQPGIIAEIIKRNDNQDINGYPIVTLFNNAYGSHYCYASTAVNSSNKRRAVYCQDPQNILNQGYWVKVPHETLSNAFYLFNTYFKEYLYATNTVANNQRTVATDNNATVSDSAVWQIDEQDGKSTIYNRTYQNFLYVDSATNGNNGRAVCCWSPGTVNNQAYWNITSV